MIYVFWQPWAARYQVDANLNQLESSNKPVAPLHAGSWGEETGRVTDHRVWEETNPASSSDRIPIFCFVNMWYSSGRACGKIQIKHVMLHAKTLIRLSRWPWYCIMRFTHLIYAIYAKANGHPPPILFFFFFQTKRARSPWNGLMLQAGHMKAIQSSTHCWQLGYSEMKRRPSPGHICSLTKYKERGYATAGSSKLFMNSNSVAKDKLAA